MHDTPEPLMEPAKMGRPHPRLVWLARHVLWPFAALMYRPRLTGTALLPESGPYLLVANHSAGMAVAELVSFAVIYVRDLGAHRPMAGFAHPVSFRFWPVSALQRSLGSVPSTYQDAAAALDQGVALLVFPGGDHESLRPIWKHDEVDFAQRLGFLKIARAHHVPIVPMGIRGSHHTAPILYRAQWLARALIIPHYVLGIHRWGVSLLGLIGVMLILTFAPLSLPLKLLLCWLWLASPLVFLPIFPSKIEFHIGAPLALEDLFAAPHDDPDALPNALTRVQRAVQDLVTPP